MRRQPGIAVSKSAKGPTAPRNATLPLFSDATLGVEASRPETGSYRQPGGYPSAGPKTVSRVSDTVSGDCRVSKPDSAGRPRGKASKGGKRAKAAVVGEPVRYELGHYPAVHEIVEPHDFDWYVGGGRRFYRPSDGRELTALSDVAEAIAGEGLVYSR